MDGHTSRLRKYPSKDKCTNLFKNSLRLADFVYLKMFPGCEIPSMKKFRVIKYESKDVDTRIPRTRPTVNSVNIDHREVLKLAALLGDICKHRSAK